MTVPAEHLTVLRARGRRLAKLLHRDGRVEGYDSAKTMDAFTMPVPDLAGILSLLQRLLTRPDCCVIRGELLGGQTVLGIRRLLHPDKVTGDAATIRDVPRRWLAIDVEGIDLPASIHPSDLAGCAAVGLSRLPTELQGAGCIVQASAQHGLRPDLRLRLWFYLDRPTYGRELKRWFRGMPADLSVFGAVQPIYTAAPVLAPGAENAIPTRLMLLPGEPLVSVPAPELLAAPAVTVRSPSQTSYRLDQAHAYVRAALVQAAQKISTTQHPGRHPAIVGETSRLARFVGAGLLTAIVIEEVISEAARQAGKDDAVEVSSAIAWGLANPWADGPLPEASNGR